MPPVGAALWRSLRAHQVYGANTDVGKTIVSTVLCNAIQHLNSQSPAAFLKPVSTGPLDDADDRHIRRYAPGTLTKCLYQFDEPVSPHIAAKQKQLTIPRDDDIIGSIHQTLSDWAAKGIDFALVETAGGVHSPGPNGNSQADLYRPLRLPIVLIADSRLGGISSSISAYESLLLRGIMNALARDEEAMAGYYERVARGTDVAGLLEEMTAKNEARIERLEAMSGRAHETIWYPFTQHHGMAPKDITVIDSAYDDFFQTYKPAEPSQQGGLRATFDGSASWWTQGLGHGNPDLALSAAYAAGRYGHVMFPGNIHEPALTLAETLLQTVGNPRLQKVFYSDNGSTGMEVAIKMGLRAACDRYGWDASQEQISILGLKGSYHGDTIGVMDCSEPSTYNKKVEWYRGRGYWFDYPQVQMSQGVWKVQIPESQRSALGADLEYSSLDAVFDLETRVASEVGQRYQEYIRGTIAELVQQRGMKFGSLIMEPVILGAGGMLFCDPLFQRCLAEVVRGHPELFAPGATAGAAGGSSWSGLPIIFDEVFTGLYRLGQRSSASFLGVEADIAVNAKLLTGGLVPLCTTLASNEVFAAFSSPQKSDALLHGHSYTAHAVGCQVAVDSLRTMKQLERSGAWEKYRRDWQPTGLPSVPRARPEVWSVWSHGLVGQLSHAPAVEGLFALGTVLSIALKDTQGGGYTSTAAQGLQQRLAAGGEHFAVHSRVLGNVLYLMASVTSTPEALREIEEVLRAALLE
ncbi:hypothetical protein CAN33_0012635 [Aspergillus niger]|uniref:Uncharacterized protein n=1 Tax=Aspergillus niger TaxID=5061 RepID=A0A505HQJ0_ASPNG|nr:hypothetical protein CAN33_0012635 [Aspergillus niger]